jgi:hypothetical protein
VHGTLLEYFQCVENSGDVNRGRTWRGGGESRRSDLGQDRDPIAKLVDVHADHI